MYLIIFWRQSLNAEHWILYSGLGRRLKNEELWFRPCGNCPELQILRPEAWGIISRHSSLSMLILTRNCQEIPYQLVQILEPVAMGDTCSTWSSWEKNSISLWSRFRIEKWLGIVRWQISKAKTEACQWDWLEAQSDVTRLILLE